MHAPDFAQTGGRTLPHQDLLFLFEHFPVPGVDANEAARRVIEQPSTLESLLESRYVREAVLGESAAWLDVSPRLFFNIILRESLAGRREPAERQTIHYLANLLGLFADADRLYRVQRGEPRAYEYLADLVEAAADADRERRFLVVSHIGNYALFLAGMRAPWIEHRRRFKHRPLSLDYYSAMSRTHFASAAKHELSQTFGLKPVFVQLATRFEYYRGGLQSVASRTLH